MKWIPISWMCLLTAANATDFMLREKSSLDKDSIIKTLTGISELQCLHKCRMNSECKYSAYKRSGDTKQSASCFLLKDSNSSENVENAPVTLHVPKTCKLLQLSRLFSEENTIIMSVIKFVENRYFKTKFQGHNAKIYILKKRDKNVRFTDYYSRTVIF